MSPQVRSQEVRVRRASVAGGLAITASVLLSACGSTVASQNAGAPTGQSRTDQGRRGPDVVVSGGDGLGGTTGVAIDSAVGGTGGGGAAPVGSTREAPAGSAPGSPLGTATGSSPVSGAGPGITATKIFLGIAYFPDAAATNSAIGAGGANSGDQRDYYNAVIGDLNKRGGLRGRKVEPIYFEYSSTSGEPLDSQDQRACDKWTKDNKVFAIFFRGRILQECARKAGALIISGDGETGPVFDRLPNLLDPSAVRLERLAQSTVSGLSRQQYFQTSPAWPTGKIGIISWDSATYRYGISNGYLPALNRLGKTAKTSFVTPPQTANSIADAGAAVSNTVLSFKAAGIDHVFIQDGPAGLFGGAGLTLLFLNDAKAQNYYPRYGFNANNVPGYSVFPADQQRGMLAVDFSDYMPSQDDGILPNVARQRCFSIMQKYGVTPSDVNTYSTAASACDQVWFVEALLNRASEPTLRGALAAAESLGTAYRSPMAYGTRLGPGRHDGADLARNSRFDDACKCMKYTSKPYEP